MPSKRNETEGKHCTALEHSLEVEGGGGLWTESVGLVGSEYRCEQHGVTSVCQCQSQCQYPEWILAGDLGLRGTDVFCK